MGKAKKILVPVDWDENYCAGISIDSLTCMVTGQTIAEIKQRMAESLALTLESMREDGDEIPAEFKGAYELQFELSAQALLKSTQNIVTQAALSKVTGINRQQLNHYMTGARNPRPDQREKIMQGIHALGNELLKVG
ncbi:MAG: type II toxin-antitoxin system HicB family antitoxin [Prevotellaceae bacterium]|jgi:predicted RNase H-like HicB family nuclease|nr:type II toxin-antitoxin system HicB family antitoxin [Prevotellaceae bacterium]